MLIITDLDTQREYIVTVYENVDWHLVHDELINNSGSDDSIDSNIIPDRACECCEERPANKRNTHYILTEREASKLRQDPRILAVVAVEAMPKAIPVGFQSGDFNRGGGQSGQQDNWGLIRHTQTINSGYNSGTDPGETYDYVLDGTGVDVVIMDSGIEAGHPEWEDANGAFSRLKQIDWYAASGNLGSPLPTDFYTDTNGHGTHVTGTVAGKTFGWAKNADIYSFNILGGSGTALPIHQAFDMINGWHNKKNDPNDPAYTGRPTVLNMSWGYIYELTVATSGFGILSINGYPVLGGRYRGATHSDSYYPNLQAKGLTSDASAANDPPWSGNIGSKVPSADADVRSLINDGVHVVIASGNYSQRIDEPGGLDYDNYVNYYASYFYLYYSRGGSPSLVDGAHGLGIALTDDNPTTITSPGFMVGAIDSNDINGEDSKADYSHSGPGVNIYAAGSSIASSWKSGSGALYHHDPNYRQLKIQGTSMAAPQVSGAVACLLHAHPDWSPSQVKKYFDSNSLPNMYETGLTYDYTVENTTHGSPNRVLYFPLHGRKVFTFTYT